MSTPVKKVPIHLQSSQNRLLIKNGRIVNDNSTQDADVFIEDGVIKQIGKNLIIPGGTRVIDVRGCYVMPGGIDPHTHLELEMMGAKSPDDFYQGTKAAIAGGTTMIIDFAIPHRGESLLAAYDRWRERADGKVCCDYALHVAVTWWSDRVRDEMRELTEQRGVNSFKMFMAYKDAFMLNDSELYATFERCKELGALAMVHAENGSVIAENASRLLASGVTGPEGHQLSRPEEVEAEAVHRACVIAQQVKAPLYVTKVMSRAAASVLAGQRRDPKRSAALYGEALACALRTAPARGQDVLREVTGPPIARDDGNAVCLTEMLASDDLQVTGSDHCTFTEEQKALGLDDFTKIPNGVNGVEDRMSVIWERGIHGGLMDPERYVAVTSTNAARIFNLYPRKGCIAEGSDADVLVLDPHKTRVISAKTHHHAVDYNVFEGMECHGVPEYVIVNGRVCVDAGDLKAVEGYGVYVETACHAPHVYDEARATAAVNDMTRQLQIDVPPSNGHHEPLPAAGAPAYARSSFALSPALSFVPSLAESTVSSTGKGPRQEGQRNMQDSTFSISEELDGGDRRSCIRVKNPPGGKSSGFW